MESVVIQIALQVPALALVIFFSLQVVRMVLDNQGEKLDRVIDVLERHNRQMAGTYDDPPPRKKPTRRK